MMLTFHFCMHSTYQAELPAPPQTQSPELPPELELVELSRDGIVE